MSRSFYIFLFTALILAPQNSKAREDKTIVYLIPGQGADYRQFKNLKISDNFDTAYVHYFTPEKGWSMKDFALALSEQIDTSRSFILIGVSLGGMLATEMADFLNPEKIILISSAKNRGELPPRYRFQKKLPVYRWVPKRVVKFGAQILQPIVEPASLKDRDAFREMLNAKDPAFLKRTIDMIMQWDRVEYSSKIVHIHGDNDHTIPVRNVKYDYLVENGSHMMVLTQGNVISVLINHILLQQ